MINREALETAAGLVKTVTCAEYGAQYELRVDYGTEGVAFYIDGCSNDPDLSDRMEDLRREWSKHNTIPMPLWLNEWIMDQEDTPF